MPLGREASTEKRIDGHSFQKEVQESSGRRGRDAKRKTAS
jgi:hypothetical protein